MHCLNLKITYDCTNHCSFCFSSYLKNISISLESLKQAIVHGSENGCNELVLSGGEPTLYPEYITKLISLADKLNYKKYIIQTNGYGLSKNEDLVSFLNEISKKTDVCISFSVHSHEPQIHDDLSGNPGAFAYLKDAMDKISKTNCRIYTNTVINSLNLSELKEIAIFLSSYNPDIMQFSMMHLKENNSLSVSFLDSVKAIRGLIGVVNLDVLKTEGVPYCLLYGMEQCVGESAWPSKLDLYNKENDYMSDFKQLEYGMRSKLRNCDKCIMDKICMGVWTEHYKEFSSMGIQPIG